MAYRGFETSPLSRRSILRGGAYAATGTALAGLPLGQLALANNETGNAGEMWGHVRALAEKFVDGGKVPNIITTFGFGQKPAQLVGKGSLAFGSKTPADMDSLYRIYSMTKPITGMAIMMCIDDGLISLDQPLAEILPAFANMQVLVDPAGSLDNTVPAERPITIRHLLTHTAGIGYIINAKGPLQKAYADNGLVGGRVSRFPIPGIPKVTAAPNLEVWADRLARLPLIAQPGTKWEYSASIDLLGRVVEVASGKPFGTFLQERIFTPCAMESTYFTVPKSEIPRLTTNYGILNGTPIPIDPAGGSIFLDKPSVPSGGGGLVSSPRDYDQFQRMLLGHGKLDGKQVMGELAVKIGVSNILPKGVDTSGSWVAGQGFGAGGRSVGSSFGWGGAAGTLASVDFDANLRAALFTQYMPSESYPIRAEFLAGLEADIKALGGA